MSNLSTVDDVPIGIMNEPPLKLVDRLLQWWRIAKVRPYIRQGARVLDIGCADGALFRQLHSRIKSGVGTDIALQQSVGNGRFQLIAGQLPWDLAARGDFDVVTMLAVVEHLPVEVIPTLREQCSEALKPGGLLLITVPSVQVDRILHALMRLHLIAGMSLHEHHGFNPADVPRLFGGSGLRLIQARTFQLGNNHLYILQKVDPGSVTYVRR
jgi:2-polyprenyl-3-methyl-5-hydroxy-6-metoxy-1,4-benzoquinol methylase